MGAIKDPLFGLSNVKKKTLDKSLEGTLEGEEEILFNEGNRIFLEHIINSKSLRAKHEVDAHFISLTLHDKAFGLTPYIEQEIDPVSGKVVKNILPSKELNPILMKSANVLFGPDNAMSTAMDQYFSEGIYEHSGINFDEWMQKTPMFQKLMIDSVTKFKRNKIKAEKEALEANEKSMKQRPM